jgi:hypothetical protein
MRFCNILRWYRDLPSEASSAPRFDMSEVRLQRHRARRGCPSPSARLRHVIRVRVQAAYQPPLPGRAAKPQVPSVTQSEVQPDRRGEGSVMGAMFGTNRAQFSDTMTI